MGTRGAAGRADNNGTGLGSVPVSATPPGAVLTSDPAARQFGDEGYGVEVVYSGSDQDSDSGDDEDAVGSGGERRGVKRGRGDRDVRRQSAANSGVLAGGYGGVGPGVPGAKPGKKTRGRVKIKMEFIDNKLRRYTTFSKRKTGIMKKAYELSTLTGTQVLLLVASETGHVYTFATRKLQPMITSETGKALIQTCLNSPDSPPRSDPSSDQRMSATGFEETDLSYQVAEHEGGAELTKDLVKPAFTVSSLSGTTPPTSSIVSTATGSLQVQTNSASWQPSTTTNGTLLKTSAGVVLPGGFTLMSGGGVSQQLQAFQVQSSSEQTGTSQSISDIHSTASSTGHMVYPGGHTVMYATPTSSLADGSLTVLNTFPPSGSAQPHDPASLPQVFLTSLPQVAAQIPVSAVQLHPMVISQQSGSSNLTELQVVSLDVHQSKED
ncbi:serum response factor-like isoform X4 [Nelusetta ayraudi]|uniref:serum response factor-like isoform X4 n=1 Tax=Nelusetta ayraudi TaxID=303726 RepID=UPI003F6F1F9E